MTRPADGRPLIALAAHAGFGIRYLLRTDILPELRRLGARILILVPHADERYFRSEFEAPGVIIERLDVDAFDRYRKRSRLLLALELLRLLVLSNRGDLTAIEIRRRRLRGKLTRWQEKLRWAAVQPAAWLLRRNRLGRRLVIALERTMFTPGAHGDLLAHHSPDLLAVTSLGFWASDAFLMREAHRNRVPVASVILSWDNPSSKGMAGAKADAVIAWTEAMARELVDYHDIDRARIFVGGVAHFDPHFRNDPAPSASEVLAAAGCVPDRAIIYFATASPTAFHGLNREVIDAVGRALAEDLFERPAQLLVRVHPLYLGRGVRRDTGDRILELQALASKFPDIVFDIPQTQARAVGFDLPQADNARLRATLRGSDVVLTPFSTLLLEAAIFDVPIINTAFDSFNPQLEGTNRLPETYPHLRRAIATGGTRQAHSPEELVTQINAYLGDRSLDADGRRRLREQECGANPGHAGIAVARYLFELATTGAQSRRARGLADVR